MAVVGTGSLFVLALNETWGFVRSHGVAQPDPPVPLLVLMFAVIGCYVAGLVLFSLARPGPGYYPGPWVSSCWSAWR